MTVAELRKRAAGDPEFVKQLGHGALILIEGIAELKCIDFSNDDIMDFVSAILDRPDIFEEEK